MSIIYEYTNPITAAPVGGEDQSRVRIGQSEVSSVQSAIQRLLPGVLSPVYSHLGFSSCTQVLQKKEQELTKAHHEGSTDSRKRSQELVLDTANRCDLPLSPVSNPRVTPIEPDSPIAPLRLDVSYSDFPSAQRHDFPPQIRKLPWFEVVRRALTTPCFPLSSPNAPNTLPSVCMRIQALLFNYSYNSLPLQNVTAKIT